MNSITVRMRTQRVCIAITAVAVLIAGCGKDDHLETAPVSGTVTYNGQPLKFGSLLFVPEGGGPSAQGKIDSDGSYTMGTYSESDGAVLGRHRVIITAMEPAGGADLPEEAIDGIAGAVSAIPERYGDLEKSGLTAVVEDDGKPINFELKDE